jgi:phasin
MSKGQGNKGSGNDAAGHFEVPAELREMIDRSVSQAREGFEKVMDVASQASAELGQQADQSQSKLAELQKKSLAFTESQVSAAFDLATKLIKAGSLDDVMKIQSEYIAKQTSTFRTEFEQAGSLLQQEAKKAAATLSENSAKLQTMSREAMQAGMEATKKASDEVAKKMSKASKPKS